uniref:Transmembrane protein 107 n=1 Tax=Callorhinchus milii TaxID=7868 RepID=V9LHS3_CALMI
MADFPETRLAAVAAHCSACISLSLFLSQQWECWAFWYIFGFCSALPALVELVLILTILRLGKKPL